jgi:hypothetical protein
MTPDERIAQLEGLVRQQRQQLEVVLAQNAVVLVLAVLLSACSGPQTARTTTLPTANAPATATAAAQATQTASPVGLDLNVTVNGMAAQHNVEFLIAVTVHNRNAFAIGIAGSCDHPAMRLTVANAATGFTNPFNEGLFCGGLTPSTDLKPSLPAGGVHTWMYGYGHVPQGLVNGFYDDAPLVAGSYSVTADIHDWHAGTFQQFAADQSLPHGTATATATVTVS